MGSSPTFGIALNTHFQRFGVDRWPDPSILPPYRESPVTGRRRWFILRRYGTLGLFAMLIGVLAFAATGCGGNKSSSGSGGKVTALPASSCTPVEYKGEGDPDVLMATDFPMQGSSRTQTAQIVGAARLLLDQQDWKAGDHKVALQVCDDATAQAAKWDPDKCSRNAHAYAQNSSLIGVVGTFNSGCAAIEIPVLNQAPGGGLLLLSPANTYGCLTEPCAGNEPEKYYPERQAQLRPRRTERSEPGRGDGRVRKVAGRQQHLHPERQGGLRSRCRQELQRRSRSPRDGSGLHSL